MGLSNSALIVIILVCCLSSVSLAAALFGHCSIAREVRWSPTIEQQRYMRDLRRRRSGILMQKAEPVPEAFKVSDQTPNS